MNRIIVLIISVVLLVQANPIFTEILNEVQTDTLLGQKFELHHPCSLIYNIPLINTQVYTPGSLAAYIDTNIILDTCGFAAIDTSTLSGDFFLQLDTGYLWVHKDEYFGDDIYYPYSGYYFALPPPEGASLSRYYCRLQGFWSFLYDWYFDYTPTPGAANDDYPGCLVSGHIYFNGMPAESAQVICICNEVVVHYDPFYIYDTTYTDNEGYYEFDSLLPARYHIGANIPPYSIGELSPKLFSLSPLTGFDLYITGVAYQRIEDLPDHSATIFRNGIIVQFTNIVNDVSIYDINGRLIRSYANCREIVWSGDDERGNKISKGIYFVRASEGRQTTNYKIVLLE